MWAAATSKFQTTRTEQEIAQDPAGTPEMLAPQRRRPPSRLLKPPYGFTCNDVQSHTSRDNSEAIKNRRRETSAAPHKVPSILPERDWTRRIQTHALPKPSIHEPPRLKHATTV
eukprot:5514499-Amphidinium_carterae.1